VADFVADENYVAEGWWLTPVILAIQKAEVRRIVVRSQDGQIVHKTLSQKNPTQKRAGRVTQGVSQHHTHKKIVSVLVNISN
jgi:hypothetical protein